MDRRISTTLVSPLSDVNLSEMKRPENRWAKTLSADPHGPVSVEVHITPDLLTGRPVYHQPQSRRMDAQISRGSKFASPSEKDMTEGIQDWLGDRAPSLFGRGAPND